MEIFDMHIHALNAPPVPTELLANMKRAGIRGGCVFSSPPRLQKDTAGTIFDRGIDAEERISEVLQWASGNEDRIFPILWIHPDEENATEVVRHAVAAGVSGFKIICNDFYVYEEKSMRLLREIALCDKPVFFHSGILWDGGVSSVYNRPLHWEALLRIENLRFSMGHCSWPWIDECIALYGKFLNAQRNGGTAQMFFDITPGTPKIYRKELLTKLYTVGYDVGHNVLFGTDATAHEYSTAWAADWLATDRRILRRLGVREEYVAAIYRDNPMRFLGKLPTQAPTVLPQSDAASGWSPVKRSLLEKIMKAGWHR